MSRHIKDITLTDKRRLRELKTREKAFFDIAFLKAMEPEARSPCIDLLEHSNAHLRQDILAAAMTGFKRGGFFIEYGATNGVELNNTLMLENELGWTGILAEPARMWHSDLKANRHCTIETRCVWRASGETLRFTEAPRGENSGISSYVSTTRKLRGNSYDVTTISLNDLLAEHNAPDVVDYMSVDTEGSEFEILNAVDWDRWSFRVMTVEHNHAPQRADIYALLTSKGYRRVFEDISNFDDWYLGPAS